MSKLLLTVDVENWYNSRLFDTKVAAHYKSWVSDLEEDLDATLELFSRLGIVCTFFVLGCELERRPTILSKIRNRGHEVAMHAYRHDMHEDLTSFKSDLDRGFKVFHTLGYQPLGYRHPYFNINKQKLEILSNFFEYDSSLVPSLHIPGHYGSPFSNTKVHFYNRMMELPLTVFPYLRLPAATGWYMRNLGYSYVKFMLAKRLKSEGVAVLCVHTWEFTPKPSIKGVPNHVFKNTGKQMVKMVTNLVRELECIGAQSATCYEFLKCRE